MTVLFLQIAVSVHALGPHEVLVLVNDQSPDSLDVALKYARLRSIPEPNVVRLSVPWMPGAVPLVITPADFAANIWEPVLKAMKDRGIGDHILAWVYSVDFPTTIAFDPDLSILGLTFLRNRLPAPEAARRGSYLSPLFGGPDIPRGAAHAAQTFDVFSNWLGGDMPLPCMMLGYIGQRGNSREAVLKCLQAGAASDGTAPKGTVYLVTGDDIRAKCRAWQFQGVVNELRSFNVATVITNMLPAGGERILGLMCGAMTVNPAAGGNVYLPGCMADHFTSHAATFGEGAQSKLTLWIQAGATASDGTVTEPFSIWTKVPSARFYVYYAAGCTMIESFFQSIRCPLQVLLVGDPLAQPWAGRSEVALEGLEQVATGGVMRVSARVSGAETGSCRKFMFMLDGKVVGNDKLLELDTARLAEGPHVIRAVGYGTGAVRCQSFVEKVITVSRGAK